MPDIRDMLMTGGPAKRLPTAQTMREGAESVKRGSVEVTEDEAADRKPSKVSRSLSQGTHTSEQSEASLPITCGAGFLNRLSDNEAARLHRLMLDCSSPTVTYTLSEETRRLMSGLRASPDGSTHSGQWWIDLSKCLIVEGFDNGHSRWSFDIDSKGGRSVMNRLRGFLAPQSLLDLARIASSGSKRLVRLQRHHVAYNADSVRRGTAPLPLDAGHGGSVSHLCDQRGCVQVNHLEVTVQHQTNLNRQRCQGPTLVVYKDVIVQEQPCAHARGTEGGERLLANTCIQRIHIVHLGDSAAAAVFNIFSDDISLSMGTGSSPVV